MNIYAVGCRYDDDHWSSIRIEFIKAQNELGALEASSYFIEILEDEGNLPVFVRAQDLINYFIKNFAISLVVKEG